MFLGPCVVSSGLCDLAACMIVLGACVRLLRPSSASGVASTRSIVTINAAGFLLLFVLHAAGGVATMDPEASAMYDQIVASARARNDPSFYQGVAQVRVGRCRPKSGLTCDSVIMHWQVLVASWVRAAE